MPKMRLGWYAGISTGLTGSVVISAFHQRPNFYSAMVHLSQSNFCLIVLLNFTLLVYSSFIFSLQRLCYGQLRAIEVEHLTERAWFAVTETCLAMTIFREEMGVWFLVMFTALLTGKIWGWIGDGRVEVLEQQPPAKPWLFHTRLSLSLAVSLLYDFFMLRYCTGTVLEQARMNMRAKVSMMVMFLFEFCILSVTSWRTAIRYMLSLVEQRIIQVQTKDRLVARRLEVRQQREVLVAQRESAANAGEEIPENQEPLPNEDDVEEMDIEVPGWSAKGEWVLWLDLTCDMIKMSMYIALFLLLLNFYGLPIHLLRDVFMTARDFVKRLSALLRYRRAIQEMNKHPDATEEDLSRENTCIICREEMRPWQPDQTPALDRVRPKKLPCGHILHLGCLKSWLERQQVCPTCRTPVTIGAAHPQQLNIAAGGQQRLNENINALVPVDPDAPRDGAWHDGQRQNQPQQQQQQQAPAAPGGPIANGGARVFRFGPFRVGLANNIEQFNQLVRPQQDPQRAINTNDQTFNTGTTTSVPRNPPAVDSRAQAGSSLSADQLLDQAVRAYQRQMQSLSHTQQQLRVAQLLSAELDRLRQQPQPDPTFAPYGQTQSLMLPQPLPVLNGMASFPALPPLPAAPVFAPGASGPVMARHGASGTSAGIPSGSADLPDGVVIPPGWSLMPLQRLEPTHSTPGQSRPQFTGGSLDMNPFNAVSQLPQSARSPPASATPVVRLGPGLVPTTTPTSVAPQFPSENTTGQLMGGQSSQSRPEESTESASSSSSLPNWGGSAQLLGTGPRAFRSSRLNDSDSDAQSSTSSAVESVPKSGVSQAERSSADAAMGSTMAATVEDADSESD